MMSRTGRYASISAKDSNTKVVAATAIQLLCSTDSLDTPDAGIFSEADRLGVGSIVAMDRDRQRTQRGFAIYARP